MFCWPILFQNEDPIPAGGQVRKVQLVINDDSVPEPDERVLVYLTDVQGGARVATDSDSGLQVQKLFNVWFIQFLSLEISVLFLVSGSY